MVVRGRERRKAYPSRSRKRKYRGKRETFFFFSIEKPFIRIFDGKEKEEKKEDKKEYRSIVKSYVIVRSILFPPFFLFPFLRDTLCAHISIGIGSGALRIRGGRMKEWMDEMEVEMERGEGGT